MTYSLAGKRVFVAGHRGMVGAALLRRLAREECEILTAGRETLDLTQQSAVQAWFETHRPQAVVMAAARVGGILANMRAPVEFLTQNLLMQTHVITAAHATGTEKLLTLGSSSIYPKHAAQPIREDALLTGPLDPSHEGYAIAKIAGLKLCEAYRRQYGADFISAQPTNLYGPGDSYDPETAHVLPALLRRIHEAKVAGSETITVWGTGTPLREFLHVDDLADALVFLLKHYSDAQTINVGSGEEVSIKTLVHTIADVVGYEAELSWDRSKPDGTPRKLTDCSRLHALGWNAARPLRDGIAQAYAHWLEHGGRG